MTMEEGAHSAVDWAKPIEIVDYDRVLPAVLIQAEDRSFVSRRVEANGRRYWANIDGTIPATGLLIRNVELVTDYEALSVTQADRDAAREIMRVFGNKHLVHIGQVEEACAIIARHRIAHSTPGDAEVRKDDAQKIAQEIADKSVWKQGGVNHERIRQAAYWGAMHAFRSLATPSGRAQAWLPISEAPHACHVLASRFMHDAGEWAYGVVMSPPLKPWTHWQPLPAAPPAQDQTKGGEA